MLLSSTASVIKWIYNWLGTKARAAVSSLEHNKIKKENEPLKQIIGDLMIKMSTDTKKGSPRFGNWFL